EPTNGVVAFLIVILVGFGIVLVDLLVRNKQITTISAIYFGLLLGLLLGQIFATALDPFLFGLEQPNAPSREASPEAQAEYQRAVQRVQSQRRGLTLLVTIVCCYVSISVLLQTKDEFRFIIPYVEFSRQVKGNRPLVLDTSVIIDGRIADICDTRF